MTKTEITADVVKAVLVDGTTYSVDDYNILQSVTSGKVVIQHITADDHFIELEFDNACMAIDFFLTVAYLKDINITIGTI
jgi:hypothetical protein